MLSPRTTGAATQGTVDAPTAEVMFRSRVTGGAPVVGLKPASIGRLRTGSLETRVNTGLADSQVGNARKHWASGQYLRRCPFYAGFGADVVADIVMVLWRVCDRRRIQMTIPPSRTVDGARHY